MSVHLQARNPAYIDVQLVNKRICIHKQSLLENNICTLIQLMITVLLDDPIICDLPIKVIKIDEFLSTWDLILYFTNKGKYV